MGAVGIVAFVVALIVVIVIHEAAHFGVARAFDIKVTEFFVGFGPRIWSRQRGETEVGFKWIPAGGYVKIAGMSPYEEIAPEDRNRVYGAKPRWQRALVIVAGPATHFVLAFLCFALWLGFVGVPTERSPEIVGVAATLGGRESPAAAAGIEPGDRLIAIGDIRDPSQEELVAFTRAHVGESIDVTVRRDGEPITVQLVPVLATVEGEQVGRIGVVLGPGRLERESAGIVGSITGAADEVGTALVGTVEGIGRIFGPSGLSRITELVFTDAPRAPDDAASVVGVSRVAGTLASDDRFGDLLYLFALVNVFVGFLNLLPLPPFDGGHLALLLIERIRGRAVDMRKVMPVSALVAAFFILFTAAVVWVDIVKPPV
jgi:membrane-associated protease RseP (regulator of RpoE activity)